MCVNYARPHIPVIPDFPSDIPAVSCNFVYLVSHCVLHLSSTCETRSVPVRGEADSCNKPGILSRIMRVEFLGQISFRIRALEFTIHINQEMNNCLQRTFSGIMTLEPNKSD